MEMSWLRRKHYDIPEIQSLVEEDPLRYLPLLASTHLAKEQYPEAHEAFQKYFKITSRYERELMEDISFLITDPDWDRLQNAESDEARRRLIEQYWLMMDPTPATRVNERRLEHYRRVHYAIRNFSLGKKPWDIRGTIYIRLGHPNHRSWSNNLVFETDPKAARVKSRLNDQTFRAPQELLTNDLSTTPGLFVSYYQHELREIPSFPVPQRGGRFRGGASLNARWEMWIFSEVGGGIEITLVDYNGDGVFEFTRPPGDSAFYTFWLGMAPETVFVRAISNSPSHYDFHRGADPLNLFVDHATFRGDQRSAVVVYLGVPWMELGL